MKSPLRAVGYARVSTHEQATEGVSIDVQEARIRAHCEAAGWLLLAVFEDRGVSAKTLDRPGLEEMITFVRAEKPDAVVVYRVDRLTRSIRDLGQLLDETLADVALSTVDGTLDTTTPNGRMVLCLLGVLAEWERTVISERTTAAMRHKRDAEGRWMGRAGYGFRIDHESGKLVEDEEQMKAIVSMKRSRRRGRSLRAIAGRHGISAALVHRLVNCDLRLLKASARHEYM